MRMNYQNSFVHPDRMQAMRLQVREEPLHQKSMQIISQTNSVLQMSTISQNNLHKGSRPRIPNVVHWNPLPPTQMQRHNMKDKQQGLFFQPRSSPNHPFPLQPTALKNCSNNVNHPVECPTQAIKPQIETHIQPLNGMGRHVDNCERLADNRATVSPSVSHESYTALQQELRKKNAVLCSTNEELIALREQMTKKDNLIRNLEFANNNLQIDIKIVDKKLRISQLSNNLLKTYPSLLEDLQHYATNFSKLPEDQKPGSQSPQISIERNSRSKAPKLSILENGATAKTDKLHQREESPENGFSSQRKIRRREFSPRPESVDSPLADISLSPPSLPGGGNQVNGNWGENSLGKHSDMSHNRPAQNIQKSNFSSQQSRSYSSHSDPEGWAKNKKPPVGHRSPARISDRQGERIKIAEKNGARSGHRDEQYRNVSQSDGSPRKTLSPGMRPREFSLSPPPRKSSNRTSSSLSPPSIESSKHARHQYSRPRRFSRSRHNRRSMNATQHRHPDRQSSVSRARYPQRGKRRDNNSLRRKRRSNEAYVGQYDWQRGKKGSL